MENATDAKVKNMLVHEIGHGWKNATVENLNHSSNLHLQRTGGGQPLMKGGKIFGHGGALWLPGGNKGYIRDSQHVNYSPTL
jgi:hypothetical protein